MNQQSIFDQFENTIRNSIDIGKAYEKPTFDGESFDKALDQKRLTTQLEAVKNCLLGGEWFSVIQLQIAAGGSESGCLARVRDLRKERFGGYTIERKRVGGGYFVYRMVKK